MKKAKLFLIALVASILVPLSVNAKDAADIYIFKGETCGFCARALSFFNTLKEDDEYKDLFNLIEYEVWNDEGNKELADDVAKKVGKDGLDGVPLIIIGDKNFDGYTSSMDDEIKATIKSYYNSDNRHDLVKEVLESGSYTVTPYNSETVTTESSKKDNGADTYIAIGIIIIAVVGFGYIIYLSRKDVDAPAKPAKKVNEEKTVSEEKESAPKKATTNKSTTKKKTTSTKKKTTNKKRSK